MLFNSGIFLFFFVAVYVLYLRSPHQLQNRLLLLASYIFYGYWDYRFLSLILISTIIDYTAGIAIHKNHDTGQQARARRWLMLSLAGNLGMLGCFKYFGFFADSLTTFAGLFGLTLSPFTLEVVLPVGISFYTFQTMGYSLDIYRRRLKPERNFLDFALFVAFFPQLMAGPIERARKLLPQLRSQRHITPDFVRLGVWLIFWGLFKKVFIADNLAPYTYWGVVPGGPETGLDIYLVNFAFIIRFYCDFSGYSDMARGLALLLGIHLSVNFHLPYFSSNPAELWSRWHMTLTRWFRDNVYAPTRALVGGRSAGWIAAIATMTVVGLWHGANWTYVVWGLAWGVVLVAYRRLRPLIRGFVRASPGLALPLKVSGVLLTVHIWMMLGHLFAATELTSAFHTQYLMVTDLFNGSAYSYRDLLTIVYYVWPLLLMQTAQALRNDMQVVSRAPYIVRYLIYLAMLVLLLANGAESERDFIYFQY